ncbi:MAG TPA: Crp/Fnr family transcriptional regulator [Terriglobales bacterium]|nr:Crp/Fnr family transcriptional regulator [Terriglobales bacterium]
MKSPLPVGPLATASMEDIARRARFLQGLSHSQRILVLERAEPHTWPADSVIAEQGTAADRLFLLVTGCARYFFLTPEGRKVNLFLLLPGELFGGACLLTKPAQFIVSTEVTKASTVLVWRRETIRALAAQIPSLLENGLAIACDYLVWYLATHLSLTSDTARERLADVLVSLSRGIGQKRATGISIEITNEQLANTCNISLFTVSRLLSEWQRNGAIVKSRGKILLCRSERLFDKAP